MEIEGLKCKGYLIAILNELELFSVGLGYYLAYLLIYLNGKFNVVKRGEFGKQAEVKP